MDLRTYYKRSLKPQAVSGDAAKTFRWFFLFIIVLVVIFIGLIGLRSPSTCPPVPEQDILCEP